MSRGLNYDDLPAALKRKVQERDEGVAAPARTAPAGQGLDTPSSPLYRCMAPDCGFEAAWTTKADADPAVWKRHQQTTGHGHCRMVLP